MQMDNGEAFIFGKSDWQYVYNTFCFGITSGTVHRDQTGMCNGNFLGIGRTTARRPRRGPVCAFGLLITNGEFVSFHGPDPTMVEVRSTNTGAYAS